MTTEIDGIQGTYFNHNEKILSNEKLFTTIQTSAYHLVREKFNWEKIANQLEEVYRKLKKK